jgi:hypothetical protein
MSSHGYPRPDHRARPHNSLAAFNVVLGIAIVVAVVIMLMR